MKLNLDPKSPVPLYHQIAEALRYRISTGHLMPGEVLPPIREAAAMWKVNMHTVRRAYAELVKENLLESRGARGTRVIASARLGSSSPKTRDLDAFVQRVLREAKERHDLTPRAFAHLLTNRPHSSLPAPSVVYVVECSETEAADHARELEAYWEVTAKPWCLSWKGEPPPGPLVATYFHYSEVRRRWTNRLEETRFAAIQLDPLLPTRIARRPGKGKPIPLFLCEIDETLALNMLADAALVFSKDEYNIRPLVVQHAREALNSSTRAPILFAPRVWDTLSREERADPRAIELKYVFTPEDLDAIGEHFGWRRQRTPLGDAG
jgi:GntR family transcriptional regulator